MTHDEHPVRAGFAIPSVEIYDMEPRIGIDEIPDAPSTRDRMTRWQWRRYRIRKTVHAARRAWRHPEGWWEVD